MEASDPFVPRLLHALAHHTPLSARPLKVTARRVTARSTLYFLGEGDAEPTFVAKVPVTDGLSEHPPLDARSQFEALQRSHGWFRDDDLHAVAEPVACLPELGVVVMRYAAGRTIDRVLSNSLLDPSSSFRAVRAAGEFLRRLHDRAETEGGEVDLREIVEQVRREEAEDLSPLQRSLPSDVRDALRDIPAMRIPVRCVATHGDYVGANLILSGPDSLTMIDPALSGAGLPDDDLARFLAHLSSTSVFVPGPLFKPVAQLRRGLEKAFLAGYGPLPNSPIVFEVRLLRQQVLRWRRRLELSRLQGAGAIMGARRHLIDRHMRALVLEAATRLRRHLRETGEVQR